MMCCDTGPVRKLISSWSKEREAAFWTIPSSYEHCSGSCSKSSGRQHPIAMRLIQMLRLKSVWYRDYIFNSTSTQYFYRYKNNFQNFNLKNPQSSVSPNPQAGLAYMSLNDKFCLIYEIYV